MSAKTAPPVLRFGAFELRAAAGELWRQGDLVKLPPQPFKVLELLARRGGEIVTRAEIRDHVWSGDTFVDFEQGLNFCVRQIREALGDSADAPQFIETLPRRGYRFLAPVKAAEPDQPSQVSRLIVLPFRMLRPDPETEFLAFSLPDAVTASLSGLRSLAVRSSMAAARFKGDAVDPRQVAIDADVDVIVTGSLLRAGDEIRVSCQLTEGASGTLLWSDTCQMTVGDAFKVQDDLTRRIVASLALPLSTQERTLLQRDVPSSARAYDVFLRANQLSADAKQWSVARDLYLQCVDLDPSFAPGWARLGRIHHVMSKYLDTGSAAGLQQAEAAFRRALELNPDLPLAHKLLAQLEVDLGRAHDAMVRLIPRARCADPEVLAGLVTTCRYCGLLDASLAAHARAVALEPKIRTSVPHTWFLQGDHARVAAMAVADYPYIVPVALAELGRGDEAVPVLRGLEQTTKTRLRDFMAAALAALEGRHADGVAALERIAGSEFRDPEGLFYVARHLASLNQPGPALALLERVVAGGFFCYPAMIRDPWLDSLRKKPAFTRLLREAETRHRASASAFAALDGAKALRA